jgi:hypothetical protein
VLLNGCAGEYDKELLFAVPRGHEEVTRLEAESAASGGLREGALRKGVCCVAHAVFSRLPAFHVCLRAGLVVQLANGQAAVVRRVADDAVRARAANLRAPIHAQALRRADAMHCDASQVLIDCNHPLAGAPLSFTLLVLAVERGTGAAGLASAVE